MPRAELKALIDRVDSTVSKINNTDGDVGSEDVAASLSLYDELLALPARTVGDVRAKLAAICRFNADGDIPIRDVAAVLDDLDRLAAG